VFYVKNIVKDKLIKKVPNEIFFLLNLVNLAYWAIDDGANTTSGLGFYLHTKEFEFSEIYLVAGIIHYKFDIFCTVQNDENRPVLHITAKSKKKFIEIIYPYFHENMTYKLR